MLLGEIVARIWPEQQVDGLAGRPLVLVRTRGGDEVVALDLLGAGPGARVLVATGEPARHIAGGAPVDAVVTAVVGEDTGKD